MENNFYIFYIKNFIISKYIDNNKLFVILLLLLIMIYYYNKFFHKHISYLLSFRNKQLDKFKAKQKVEDALYVKNILNEKIDELKFKTLFKFGHDSKLKPAIQRLFEDNNKPVDISYSRIKKFNAYLDFKKNNNVYEVELKTCQFILYAIPILILSWFLIFFSAILYEAYIIYNFYSKLYAEKLNLSQILPYHQQNVNQGHEIIGILSAIIAIIGMLIVFKIVGFFNMRKLKIDLDLYYKRAENETEKFKRSFIFLIIVFIVAIIVFVYLTVTTVKATNNNQTLQVVKLAKLNPKCALSLPTHQAYNEEDVKCLLAENKLGVMYYLGSKGFLKDNKKAIYLWNKAANRGYPYSELNLGYVYAKYARDKRHILIKTKKNQYLSKARLLIEKAFYNQEANRSIRALAQKVWNHYELWKYPVYKTSK